MRHIGWLIALLAITSAAPVFAEQFFTIGGTVVRAGSNQPLKKIRVTIAPVQTLAGGVPIESTPLSMVTGDDGRFVFTRQSAGKFTLQAQGHNFTAQNYQQHGQFSTAIVTGPVLDSEHVIFPLSAGGSINGSVYDSEGDPVGDGQVWLIPHDGHAQIRASASTNSAGEFRFSHLPPGSYYLAVHASPWYAQQANRQEVTTDSQANSTSNELDVTYPLTYYGDTTEPKAASLISVAEGGKVPVRITLRAVPSIHVRLSGVQVSPTNGLNLAVFQFGPGGVQLFAGAHIESFNGQWELTGIGPGRYFVSVLFATQGPTQQAVSQFVDLEGDTSIDVSSVTKSALSGRLVFEGAPAPSHAVVLLSPVAQGQARALFPRPDGTFDQGPDAGPGSGRFFVVLANAPGFYLKSVTVKGAGFSHGVLDIEPGEAIDLTVAAAAGDAQIDGVALKNGTPEGAALVVAIPEDISRSDLIAADQSDSDGTFTLPNLTPGRYTVVAIENGFDLAYTEPAAIGPYLSQGEAVTTQASGKLKIKIGIAARLP